jgi:hypothetical protein
MPKQLEYFTVIALLPYCFHKMVNYSYGKVIADFSVLLFLTKMQKCMYYQPVAFLVKIELLRRI